MKAILAATDFSYNARNAVDYAAELALQSNAKLILFHVFYLPTLPPEGIPTFLPYEVIEKMEKECLEKLEEIKHELQNSHKQRLQIECACREGIVTDQINILAEEKNVDMVVMGIKGIDSLTEMMLGSNTAMFAAYCHRPLLAINENVSFKKIRKIALACGEHAVSEASVIKPLKDLAEQFKAHIYVLNVVNEPETVLSGNKAVASVSFENALEHVEHTVQFVENEDVIDGINEFAEKKNIDLVAMIPGKHTLLKRIFYKSNTKKMIFHTHLPLLVLPDTTTNSNY